MVERKSPTALLAEKYADIFVALFDRISSDPVSPFLVPAPYPQQNVNGNIYSGANSFLTALVSSSKGYKSPIWLTFNQAKEIGVDIRKGEHSIPIACYRYSIIEKDTGKKSDITREEYEKMDKEEREKYETRCFCRSPWSVFNLEQTNFNEVMPDKYAELIEKICGPVQRSVSEELLDMIVENDSWICPIRVNSNFDDSVFSEEKGIIMMRDKDKYIDHSVYYSTLLYHMAQSASSGINPEVAIDSTFRNLTCQLSSAMLCSLVGIDSRITRDNLTMLKKWSMEISMEPMTIYRCVNDASRITGHISSVLGIGEKKSIDFSLIMNEAEQDIQRAQDNNRKKNSSGQKIKNTQIKLRR